MIRRSLITALLSATALSACAVGPTYQAPGPIASAQGTFVSAEPTIATADAKEGIAVFREKREPVFTGR